MSQNHGICVIGGGIGAFHVLEGLAKAAKSGVKVTAIYPDEFIEFGIAATPILANPQKYHHKFTCTQWKRFPDIEYICAPVTGINVEKQILTLKNAPQISYDVCIVATGSKLPLLSPTPGMTIAERQLELLRANNALKTAPNVVINGAGLIGVELAGDLRAKCLRPSQNLFLISRDGKVLKNVFPNDDIPNKAAERLGKMNVTIKKGEVASVNDGPPTTPCLTQCTIKFKGDVPDMTCDAYIPCFQQGGYSDMFPDNMLDNTTVKVNKFMQSTANERIFLVGGCSDHKMIGHPVAVRTVAVAKTCAQNAINYMNSTPLVEHVDKEFPPPGTVPGMTKVGHGKGAYMYWTDPGVLDYCCCLKCKGGFPFCPPPICWCCCHPCACGYCCGPNESEAAAIVFEGMILPQFLAPHGFIKPGVGLPPFPQQM